MPKRMRDPFRNDAEAKWYAVEAIKYELESLCHSYHGLNTGEGEHSYVAWMTHLRNIVCFLFKEPSRDTDVSACWYLLKEKRTYPMWLKIIEGDSELNNLKTFFENPRNFKVTRWNSSVPKEVDLYNLIHKEVSHLTTERVFMKDKSHGSIQYQRRHEITQNLIDAFKVFSEKYADKDRLGTVTFATVPNGVNVE